MAHKKAAGSTKNGRDSNPKYLGIKVAHGETTMVGAVLVRQRGTKILAGANVGIGKDHTLYALKGGVVNYKHKRKIGFNGLTVNKKIAAVNPHTNFQ